MKHGRTCPCQTCDSLAARVQTTEAWLAEHKGHTGKMQPLKVEAFPHPSGDWLRLLCPCGKKHVTTRDQLHLDRMSVN